LICFLHSSDLHIGKPFGRFDDDLRARLREARFQKIARLAAVARDGGASLVLLAGDTFDAETPPPQLMRQTIRAFAQESDITWVILPGNHDSLAATELWARFSRECPSNVILALQEAVIEVGSDLAILPAPCPVRHAGRDLTTWMDGAQTDPGRVRLGLAHGAIQGFSEEDRPLDLIAPDRARLAGLEYLALGDWHGPIEVTGSCHYSGTPESDSFKHDIVASALLVEIDAPGVAPRVRKVETGQIRWQALELDFQPGDAPAERLDAAVPEPAKRRDTLLRLTATGRLSLSERARLEQAISDIDEDFATFEFNLQRLDLEHETADLDDIEPTAGALRAAAERLLAGAENPDVDAEARRVSRAALGRLYSYALRVQE
jgi:DNA repair exonuclease SbcCD nuclease subunit